MARKREPLKHELEIEHKGRTYRGHYVEVSGGVAVFYDGSGKWAHLYSSPREHLAAMLLRELVEREASRCAPKK